MKRVAAAALAVVCLTSGSAHANGLFEPYKGLDQNPTVSLVRMTLGTDDSRTYEVKGYVVSGGHTFNFTGVGTYNPATKRATERLEQMGANGPDGGEILTVANCDRDPWQTGLACTGGKIDAKGYLPQIYDYIASLVAPISAAWSDQAAFAAALKAAEAAEAARKARLRTTVGHKVELLPTPTPPPTVVKDARFHSRSLSSLPAKPLYGAVYVGGNPPAAVKAGHVVDVPVTVENTSSQTWPAGGAFRLSFHWFRGGARLADGDRTLLPFAVAPGATVNVNAKVTAPARPGDATLQWDMEQEGSGWFSDKGVAMSTPKAVSVKP